MLKRYLSSSIIVLCQFILLGIIISLCAPLLLQNSNLAQHMSIFLTRYQTIFLVSHGLFYLAFYVSWPRIVKFLAVSQPETPQAAQIKKAIQIRIYLLAIFLSIELINILR